MSTIKYVGTEKRKLTDRLRKMIEAETSDKPQPKKDGRKGKPNPQHNK